MTEEEKKMLRLAMEEAWDFFDGLSTDSPPPEYFMRGPQEPRWYVYVRKLLPILLLVFIFGTAMLSWGNWLRMALTLVGIIGIMIIIELIHRLNEL